MEFHQVTTIQEVQKLMSKLPSIIAIDTEYSDLNVRKAELLSVVISTNGRDAYTVDPKFIKYLEPIKNCKALLFQNFTVDVFILAKYGLDLSNCQIFDTMLMHHLIDENAEHSLESMVINYYSDSYKKEFWEKFKTYQEASEYERLEYEGKDANYTYLLGMKFLEELKDKSNLVEHVHRLAKALFDTEVLGVKVDVDLINQTQVDMSQKIASYLPKLRKEFKDEVTIWELKKWSKEISKRKTAAGKDRVVRPNFSFSSDKQLSWLLFECLHLPVISKTKKGNPSTDYETLVELGKEYSRISPIVQYKGDKTLYSAFVEGMQDRIEDGRIYPRFNVNGTHTGRISHSNPNLGNLPKDGPIRSFFISNEHHSIIGADYSQLEVIVEANLTKDPQLLKIILEGASKHDITANGLGVDRNTAKTLNFALQYGAGIFKVSKILGVSHGQANDIFERYWRIYSGVKSLKDKAIKEVEETGEITNIFGRTRHFDKPRNEYEKAKIERQAYNFLIQGPAGDVCNRAFYQMHERLKANGHGRTLWPVHDEIICEIKDEYVEEEKEALTRIMEEVTQYVRFEYPLQAVSYGPLKAWAKT